jgi:GntP family gluconate:H+ symporter
VNEVEPALGTAPLLLIALGAVLVLLFLIIRIKLHAFVALIVVSLLTAVATRIPLDEIVPTAQQAFGTTLGSVALLVGLGAMLGRLLEVTGGAQVLADTLIRRFGEKRAPLALGIAALLFGFPIFFDAGLVVFLPIVFTVARRLGGSLLRFAMPVAAAFSVMHAFVPPHPGPVAATELIGADIGLVLIFGLIVALPTWYLGGYLFGTWIGQRIDLPVPDVLGGAGEAPGDATGGTGGGGSRGGGAGTTPVAGTSPQSGAQTGSQTGVVDEHGGRAEAPPPSFGTVVFLLLLPMILIFLNTGLETLGTNGTVDPDTGWVQALRAIGATPVALTITLIMAMWLLGWRRRVPGAGVEKVVNDALGPVCAIILITGAGGMFGGVLRASGVGDALAETLEDTGLPVIVAAFIISVCLRVAQGSATVALTTTAGLISPVVAATSGLSSADLALIVIAIAGGSIVASHFNDSGFWLVGRFLGMDEKTTLKTWTVMETLLGTIGFVFAWILSLFL